MALRKFFPRSIHQIRPKACVKKVTAETPKGTLPEEIYFDNTLLEQVDRAGITIEKWENKHIVFESKGEVPREVLVGQTYFSTWKAAIIDQEAQLQEALAITADEASGLMRVGLPAGTHKVQVWMPRTTLQQVGITISIIGWCIIVWFFWRQKNRS